MNWLDFSSSSLVNFNRMVATCVCRYMDQLEFFSYIFYRNKPKRKTWTLRIQRECVSERTRITADTIQFVQPFRNILFCSYPRRTHAHIKKLIHMHIHKQRVKEKEWDPQSSTGMFALRHTEQLSSHTTTIRNVSRWICRCACVCTRALFSYGMISITSPACCYTINWLQTYIPSSLYPSKFYGEQ